MVTEKFQFTAKLRSKGPSFEKTVRTVEITGKDLPKFADVLLAQAKEAHASGQVGRAAKLERLAARVRTARKFTMPIPLDEKISG